MCSVSLHHLTQYESSLHDYRTNKEEPAMKLTVVIAFLLVAGLLTAESQRGGGGRVGGGAARAGGGAGRASGGFSANRNVSSTSIRSSQDVNRNVTRNGDINRN